MKRHRQKATHKMDARDLTGRDAVWFYSIIASSFGLPALIAFCVIFIGFSVKLILGFLLFFLLGGIFYTYRRISRQIEAFQTIVEHLADQETDTEIRLLGGIVGVRIERDVRRLLPHPVEVEQQSDTELEGDDES